MTRLNTPLLLAGSVAALCLASDWDRMPVRDRQVIHKQLPLSGPPMRVVVDNVEGYVHVSGGQSNMVDLTAEKVIRADSDADLAEARKEVDLEVSSKPGSVSAYYTAPWRNHERERHFYSVAYNIDIKMPAGARTFLSTVNRGDIRLENTSGDFEAKNVNGAITIAGVSGSGEAHTVNGPIRAEFAQNPQAASEFKTVNGSIDVFMQPSLAADLLFKTLNGEIFSDFEVATRSVDDGERETHGAKFVYHSHGPKGARVGGGGPELRFETLNGNVRLHRVGRKENAG